MSMADIATECAQMDPRTSPVCCDEHRGLHVALAVSIEPVGYPRLAVVPVPLVAVCAIYLSAYGLGG